jgi:hypothetical protein
MTNKTLVCIIAETRESALAYESFKKNVIDALDADLALCISEPEGYDYKNPYWQTAKYKWTTPEYTDWSEAYDFAKQTSFSQSTSDWRKFIPAPGGNCFGPIASPTPQYQIVGGAAILIFYRWFLWYNLNKENLFEKYDRIIVVRSDFIYMCPHVPMSMLDPAYVWIPDGEWGGGVTDRCAVLSKNNAESYLNIMKHIMIDTDKIVELLMPGRDYRNFEQFIKFILDLEGTSYKFFPYIMYSVRSVNGRTRFSQGVWREDLGYFVKYPDEYNRVMNNMRTFDIKDINDWSKYSI